MTCIVAYIDGNVVLMSSDSVSNTECGSRVVRRGVPKVWTVNVGIEIIVGFCGNFGNGQWLRHGFEWPRFDPEIDDRETVEEWLVSRVQRALRIRSIERFGLEDSKEWVLLIGLARPGRLFVLSPCGDVEESFKKFAAIGSGAEVAKGALEALESFNMMPWERLEAAMSAAKEFRCDVGGPVHMHALVAAD